MNGHLWVVGGAPKATTGITVNCHRRLRGPYTGVGSVLRIVVPQVRRRHPGLARAHAIEIMAIAPELTPLIEVPPQTLTELAVKDERTRLYARTRTGRLAHGVVDLLLDWAAAAAEPLTLSFTNADEADSTDQEFLAILLRRARGEHLRVVVATRGEDVTQDLAAGLRACARRIEAPPPDRRDLPGRAELVRAYVWSDGTSGDPAEAAAYSRADPRVRAGLHDERAAELQRAGERSLRLGAIPYHLEHGTDPASAVPMLHESLDHCLFQGFYQAAVDLGVRGQAVSNPDADPDYWYYGGRVAVCHAALGKSDAAEAINLDVRARCTIPSVHMTTSCALAMLYTRYLAPERRDLDLAKAYINNAIALASWWPDLDERTFHSVFNHNGLALVEMRAGDLPEALRLVTEGLARLNRDVQASAYLLHRSVLMHNRANVLLRLGRPDEAISDLGSAIEADPNYPEYYFDRANALHKLGRSREAIRDYDTAVTLSLPFWELHYNRAAVRAELGDLAGAIVDFGRVVELEPDQLDPWISLVSLLLDSGDLATAGARIEAGLARHPAEPQLLCARAQLALEEGRTEQAGRDFDLALAADSSSVPALAGRAALAYEAGEHDAAIDGLTRAIEAGGVDLDLLYNRAQVYQETGDWHAAIGDYSRALELPGAELGELAELRDRCYAELAAP